MRSRLAVRPGVITLPRMTMTIDLVAGARPNFMKVAPVWHALAHRHAAGSMLRPRLVLTGQHSDDRMAGVFRRELGLPEPEIVLGCSGDGAAAQAGVMIAAYGQVLRASRPAACVVFGDVTSTVSCALAAAWAQVPLAHVEAGLRSGDRTMPEEINRLATDAVSERLFTTSQHAGEHLRREGVPEERIRFVGNTMIDSLLQQLPYAAPPEDPRLRALDPGRYLLLTLHRPSNVDTPQRLAMLLEAVVEAARGEPVVFAVHPRTRRMLEVIARGERGLLMLEPQPYRAFLHLLRQARAVLTDSGGVTEEATVLGVPCLTLRETTERPETVEQGTNLLLGSDPASIAPAVHRIHTGPPADRSVPPLWDGRAGERIAAELEAWLAPESGARIHG